MCCIQPLAALSFSHEKCRNNWNEIRALESTVQKPGSFLTSVQLDNHSNESGCESQDVGLGKSQERSDAARL